MYRTIWDWLGIDETNDKQAIKMAFAEMAKVYHPAEHPQEFQELRNAYNQALKLADRGTIRRIPASEIVLKESAPSSSFEFDFEEDEDEEDEEEYSFDLKDKQDNSDKYSYEDTKDKSQSETFDFGAVTNTAKLSLRQRDMLYFFRGMMEIIALSPLRYGAAPVFKALFYNWNKSPYCMELTPDFISLLLDVLANAGMLQDSAYSAFEEILLSNRKGDEAYRPLFSRLAAIRLQSSNLVKRSYKPIRTDIIDLFSKYSNDIITLKTGFIYDEPIDKHLVNKVFQLEENILVSVHREFKYYFVQDLECTIDPDNDNLTIRDVLGDVILKLRSSHPTYNSFLKHLIRQGCDIKCADLPDSELLIESLENKNKPGTSLFKDKRFMGLFNSRIRLLLISLVGVAIEALLVALYAVIDIYNLGSIPEQIGSILMIGSLVVFWLPVIAGFFALLQILVYLVSMAKMLPIMNELQKDYEEGKVLYSMGNRCFLFENHLIIATKEIFHVISLQNVERFDFHMPDKEGGASYLSVGKSNDFQNLVIGDIELTKTIHRLTRARMNRNLKCDQNQYMSLYDYLSSKKSIFYKRRCIISKEIKDCLDRAILWIFVITCYDGFAIFDYATNARSVNSSETIAFVAVFFILLPIHIIKLIALFSILSKPNKLLLDASLDMKDSQAERYKNDIYLLKDHFVSLRYGIVNIIPYREMEWAKTEDSDHGYILVIKQANKKDPHIFCNGTKTAENKAMTLKIMGELYRRVPSLTIRESEKAIS